MSRLFLPPVSKGTLVSPASNTSYVYAGNWFFSSNACTLSLWIKPIVLPGDHDVRLWVKHDGHATNTGAVNFDWMIGLASSVDANKLRIRFNNSSPTLIGTTVLGASHIEAWQHVAAVLNNGTARLYLNGVEDGSLGGFLTANFNTGAGRPVAIGNNAPYSGGASTNGIRDDSFDGYIDYPAAWSSALTPAQILSLAEGADPATINPASIKFYISAFGDNSTDTDDIGSVTTEVYNAAGSTEDPLPAIELLSLTLRSDKGSALTYQELDNNFKYIDEKIAHNIQSSTNPSSVTPVLPLTQHNVKALAQALTIQAPSGDVFGYPKFLIRIKDNGTARALTWNAAYTGTLPASTVAGKVNYFGFVYNGSTWNLAAKGIEP
jgi:hypothetical protein